MATAAAIGVVLVLAGACASDGSGSKAGMGVPGGRPTIAVTTPVLGAAVSELVGDQADVQVLMPNGVDPHEYRPSARDARDLAQADLIVANGLGLEEGLTGAIDQAAEAGTPVFRAADHIDRRTLGADDRAADAHAADEHAGEGQGTEAPLGGHHEGDGHDHGTDDPHFWVDPVAMGQAMGALATQVHDQLGIDLGDRPAQFEATMGELDARTRATLSAIPPDRRLLVTGHESLGYFADRYGFTVVGAVVPSTTSQAAATAADLAQLRDEVRRTGVPAIFIDAGTSPALADAMADETGATVVELATHTLPPEGSYPAFIDDLADGIRRGLAP